MAQIWTIICSEYGLLVTKGRGQGTCYENSAEKQWCHYVQASPPPVTNATLSWLASVE